MIPIRSVHQMNIIHFLNFKSFFLIFFPFHFLSLISMRSLYIDRVITNYFVISLAMADIMVALMAMTFNLCNQMFEK